MKWKLEQRKLADIKLNPDNPRLIKDDKYKKLVQSIKDFPEMLELRPVVVNKDLMVLGGNMRLKACQEAGLSEIPILKAENLTKEQQKEFIIKDNVSYGEWDFSILANEWNFDELITFGFDEKELTGYFENEATEDDFAIPDKIETDIKLGDLFQIGEHRLLCGDSIKREDVERLMDGEKADMVFTDPPYNHSYNKLSSSKRKFNKKIGNVNQNTKFKNDLNYSEYDINKMLPVFLKNCKNRNIFIFCDKTQINKYLSEDNGIFQIIPFVKKQCAPYMAQLYLPLLEFAIHFYEKTLTQKQGHIHENAKPYFITNTMKGEKTNIHPTSKKVEALSPFILNSSNKNDLILDFYLGSGSTMIACEQLNRKCYGLEISPEYCQVIIDRILKLNPKTTVNKIK